MIRVISLADADERRFLFCEAAARTVLPWHFFDAHRGAADYLTNDAAILHRTIQRNLAPAEIGCYSSHVGVWKEFIESADPLLIVLEDDIILDWAYIEFLYSHNFQVLGIDYLRLFNKIPVKQKLVKTEFLSRYYHLVRNLSPPLGTQAYLLTRAGAERLYRHALIMRRPIDIELDRSWAHGLPSLSIVPSPLFERFVPSSIGDERFQSRRRFDRIRPQRLFEKGRKTVYNIKLHWR